MAIPVLDDDFDEMMQVGPKSVAASLQVVLPRLEAQRPSTPRAKPHAAV